MSATVDVGLYWRQKKVSQDWFYLQGRGDVDFTIAMLSASTHVPCIVTAMWIGEVNGWDEKLISTTKNIIKFYGLKQILNTPDNFPEELVKFLEN